VPTRHLIMIHLALHIYTFTSRFLYKDIHNHNMQAHLTNTERYHRKIPSLRFLSAAEKDCRALRACSHACQYCAKDPNIPTTLCGSKWLSGPVHTHMCVHILQKSPTFPQKSLALLYRVVCPLRIVVYGLNGMDAYMNVHGIRHAAFYHANTHTQTPTFTNAHIYTYTNTHTRRYTHSHTFCLSPFLPSSLSNSFSVSFFRASVCSLSPTFSLSFSLFLFFTLTYTHTYTYCAHICM